LDVVVIMGLIQKIKAFLPPKDIHPYWLWESTLHDVPEDVLQELADMVDKRRAELLDRQ
jgi:hypothetical protein